MKIPVGLKRLVFYLGMLFVLTNLSGVYTVHADEWFDSYSGLAWKEEVLRIENFGIFLSKRPRTLGYIAWCGENADQLRTMRLRATKARSYLVREFKLNASRIVLLDGGKCVNGITILQPVGQNEKPPAFFR
jgi:hypothetical protein